jgi:hypothetical protein
MYPTELDEGLTGSLRANVVNGAGVSDDEGIFAYTKDIDSPLILATVFVPSLQKPRYVSKSL